VLDEAGIYVSVRPPDCDGDHQRGRPCAFGAAAHRERSEIEIIEAAHGRTGSSGVDDDGLAVRYRRRMPARNFNIRASVVTLRAFACR